MLYPIEAETKFSKFSTFSGHVIKCLLTFDWSLIGLMGKYLALEFSSLLCEDQLADI